jgi:DNA-binding HxlR family transcriptional regulator
VATGLGRERTYGQFCAIAAALDVVGDRWTLLICRELVFGDCRFTDLRNALPGIAPNLLTERLRALQTEGLVTTVELPPPAARTVYRLTESGHEIVPVLRALARFGSRYLDPSTTAPLPAVRAAHGLLLAWREPPAADPSIDLRVRLVLSHPGSGDRVDAAEEVDIVLSSGLARVVPSDGPAGVTIETTASDLVRARQGEPLRAKLTGRVADRKAALAAFGLRLAH